MGDVDLAEYDLVCQENGDLEKIGGKIILKNRIDGNMLAAVYDDVAEFYNLPRQSLGDISPPFEQNEQQGSEIHKWSDDETETLLELYIQNQDKVGPIKRFRCKKDMWVHIAQECGKRHNIKVAHEQVEGRYKTVIKKAKLAIKNNSGSGASRKKIPFESSMLQILKNDDSLVPEIFIGPNKILRKEDLLSRQRPSTSTCVSASVPLRDNHPTYLLAASTSSIVPTGDIETPPSEEVATKAGRKKSKSFSEKMIEKLIENKDVRSKLKEENKERRHRENQEKLEKIEKLLENVLTQANK